MILEDVVIIKPLFEDKQLVWCLKPTGQYKAVDNERTVYVIESAERGRIYNHSDVRVKANGECEYIGVDSSKAWHWRGCLLVAATGRNGKLLFAY